MDLPLLKHDAKKKKNQLYQAKTLEGRKCKIIRLKKSHRAPDS